MANINLTPKEVLALYETLSTISSGPWKPKKGCEHYCDCEKSVAMYGQFEEVSPIETIIQKLKELLEAGIENIETSTMKAKLSDWLKQEEARIHKLRAEQNELNKGKNDIHNQKVPARVTPVQTTPCFVRPGDPIPEVTCSDTDLTRELNEDKMDPRYPKPAPRPVMPQHGKFRGKHNK